MVLHLVQDATTWLTHANFLADSMQSLHGHWWSEPWVLAQQVRQTDLMGDLQKWFDNLVKTGQLWAFLIGLVFGYLLKAFTTFG